MSIGFALGLTVAYALFLAGLSRGAARGCPFCRGWMGMTP